MKSSEQFLLIHPALQNFCLNSWSCTFNEPGRAAMDRHLLSSYRSKWYAYHKGSVPGLNVALLGAAILT